MAIAITEHFHKVERSASGIFIRKDPGFGLLIHSPYTGLTYAVQQSDEDIVVNWLNKPDSMAPSKVYKYSVGARWAITSEEAQHPIPHLLPDISDWPNLSVPNKPILINWFLTGRCPLACKYCYAEDLMRDESTEPNKTSDVLKTAEAILSFNPLVVVLTGGDPLFSKHVSAAVKFLSGKVGIVLDTSGYTLTPYHVKLFKEHGVSVRISLDAERPRINQKQRELYKGYPKLVEVGVPTAQRAVEALSMCLEAGLSVTVQTVATKNTVNELLGLGDKLFRLGVRSWRIFKVAPSETQFEEYLKLVGKVIKGGKKLTPDQVNKPYKHIFEKIRIRAKRSWQQAMAVQITYDEKANAVILVGPNGYFYTESNTSLGKVILDETNPTKPSIESIRSKVNMLAHAERYLNNTGALTGDEVNHIPKKIKATKKLAGKSKQRFSLF